MFNFLAYAILAIITQQKSQHLQLQGDSDIGYYWVDLLVGTPPQRQSLILDTGSSYTIFPCSGCQGCNHKHRNGLFNLKESSTVKKMTPQDEILGFKCPQGNCRFYSGYSEGSSYNGSLYYDKVKFDGEEDQQDVDQTLIFGCAEQENGMFYEQDADGIMGIGLHKNDVPLTMIETEKKEKRLDGSIISICYGLSGGSLGIGDDNKHLHAENAKTQVIQSNKDSWEDQYNVPLTNINIGGKDVDFKFQLLTGNDSAFFDSGTTFVYFGYSLYQKFLEQFQNFCQQGNGNCGNQQQFYNCFQLPQDPNEVQKVYDSFPPIKFFFQDTEYNWYPRDYFAADLDDPQKMCLGIGQLKNVILGGTFFRNYDITIDKVNQRISFTRANCGSTDTFYTDYPNDYPQKPKEVSTSDDLKKVVIEKEKVQTEQIDTKIDLDQKRAVMIQFVAVLTLVTLFFVFVTIYNYYKEKKKYMNSQNSLVKQQLIYQQQQSDMQRSSRSDRDKQHIILQKFLIFFQF